MPCLDRDAASRLPNTRIPDVPEATARIARYLYFFPLSISFLYLFPPSLLSLFSSDLLADSKLFELASRDPRTVPPLPLVNARFSFLRETKKQPRG